MDEFAEETGVFGLNVLRTRLSRTEKMFWVLCTLFFAYCNARDLMTVTLSYLSEDTLSLTSQIMNSNILLSPTISFTLNLNEFDFLNLPANKTHIEQEVEDFIAVFQNFTLPATVDETIFELVISMLEDMTANENAIFSPSLATGTENLEWASEYTNRADFGFIQASTGTVYKRFRM